MSLPGANHTNGFLHGVGDSGRPQSDGDPTVYNVMVSTCDTIG